jgi:hypothetical protein
MGSQFCRSKVGGGVVCLTLLRQFYILLIIFIYFRRLSAMGETEQIEQYRSLIGNISLFSYLTEAELENILSRGEILHYKKGDKIIYLGDVSPYFYGIIKDNPQAGNKILMLIVHRLLHKLREANQELAFEKQSVIDLDDLDSLVQDFMSKS